MLYTFSQQYPPAELRQYLAELNAEDALVLWGDAVLMLLKQADQFQTLNAPCYVMNADLLARNLTFLLEQNPQIQPIEMADFVSLTEKFTPQLGL